MTTTVRTHSKNKPMREIKEHFQGIFDNQITGFVLTNNTLKLYTKGYYTVHINADYFRMIDTTKNDWVFSFNNGNLYLNGELKSSTFNIELAKRVTTILSNLQKNKLSIFEEKKPISGKSKSVKDAVYTMLEPFPDLRNAVNVQLLSKEELDAISGGDIGGILAVQAQNSGAKITPKQADGFRKAQKAQKDLGSRKLQDGTEIKSPSRLGPLSIATRPLELGFNKLKQALSTSQLSISDFQKESSVEAEQKARAQVEIIQPKTAKTDISQISNPNLAADPKILPKAQTIITVSNLSHVQELVDQFSQTSVFIHVTACQMVDNIITVTIKSQDGKRSVELTLPPRIETEEELNTIGSKRLAKGITQKALKTPGLSKEGAEKIRNTLICQTYNQFHEKLTGIINNTTRMVITESRTSDSFTIHYNGHSHQIKVLSSEPQGIPVLESAPKDVRFVVPRRPGKPFKIYQNNISGSNDIYIIGETARTGNMRIRGTKTKPGMPEKDPVAKRMVRPTELGSSIHRSTKREQLGKKLAKVDDAYNTLPQSLRPKRTKPLTVKFFERSNRFKITHRFIASTILRSKWFRSVISNYIDTSRKEYEKLYSTITANVSKTPVTFVSETKNEARTEVSTLKTKMVEPVRDIVDELKREWHEHFDSLEKRLEQEKKDFGKIVQKASNVFNEEKQELDAIAAAMHSHPKKVTPTALEPSLKKIDTKLQNVMGPAIEEVTEVFYPLVEHGLNHDNKEALTSEFKEAQEKIAGLTELYRDMQIHAQKIQESAIRYTLHHYADTTKPYNDRDPEEEIRAACYNKFLAAFKDVNNEIEEFNKRFPQIKDDKEVLGVELNTLISSIQTFLQNHPIDFTVNHDAKENSLEARYPEIKHGLKLYLEILVSLRNQVTDTSPAVIPGTPNMEKQMEIVKGMQKINLVLLKQRPQSPAGVTDKFALAHISILSACKSMLRHFSQRDLSTGKPIQTFSKTDYHTVTELLKQAIENSAVTIISLKKALKEAPENQAIQSELADAQAIFAEIKEMLTQHMIFGADKLEADEHAKLSSEMDFSLLDYNFQILTLPTSNDGQRFDSKVLCQQNSVLKQIEDMFNANSERKGIHKISVEEQSDGSITVEIPTEHSQLSAKRLFQPKETKEINFPKPDNARKLYYKDGLLTPAGKKAFPHRLHHAINTFAGYEKVYTDVQSTSPVIHIEFPVKVLRYQIGLLGELIFEINIDNDTATQTVTMPQPQQALPLYYTQPGSQDKTTPLNKAGRDAFPKHIQPVLATSEDYIRTFNVIKSGLVIPDN
ncbi:hypothetical protein ACFL96_00335 [Thermoproteota archaeon]